MLVLSRKLGERLVIGDNITVVVSRVAGNRVTLGIEAPADVRIVRSELTLDAPTARVNSAFDGADGTLASLQQLAK